MRVAARRPVPLAGSVWVRVCVARQGRGSDALQFVDADPAPSLTAPPRNDATRTPSSSLAARKGLRVDFGCLDRHDERTKFGVPHRLTLAREGSRKGAMHGS